MNLVLNWNWRYVSACVYACRHRHKLRYVIYIPYFCLLKGLETDNTVDFNIPFSTKKNQSSFEKWLEAEGGKVQDKPTISYCAKKQGITEKIMEISQKSKGIRRVPIGPP
jgi:hypothetical protein